jgi:hypothetical protein
MDKNFVSGREKESEWQSANLSVVMTALSLLRDTERDAAIFAAYGQVDSEDRRFLLANKTEALIEHDRHLINMQNLVDSLAINKNY